MANILIKRVGARRRAYPLGTHIRITSHLGPADLRYVTDDGWVGVHVDGDPNPRREDEIFAAHCSSAAGLTDLIAALADGIEAAR